jgi:hypothetical protein
MGTLAGAKAYNQLSKECAWPEGQRGGIPMSRISPFGNPFAYRAPPTFSAWAMAIAFATVAMLSFAIDQTVALSSAIDEQQNSPSLLHPVQLIETLIDAASE